MINAGELKKRVTLQQQTITRDTYGGETITWSTVATVWAKIEPLESIGSSKVFEKTDLQQVSNEAKYKITIRFRNDINVRMRLKYGNRYLYIDSITNQNDANQALFLYCFEDVI